MHARKLIMYQKADGFIALPGGFGTMEELLEVITWLQLGIHSKPIGLLNVGNYWGPLLMLIQNGVEQGFIKDDLARNILVVADNATQLLDMLAVHIPPVAEFKWLQEDQI